MLLKCFTPFQCWLCANTHFLCSCVVRLCLWYRPRVCNIIIINNNIFLTERYWWCSETSGIAILYRKHAQRHFQSVYSGSKKHAILFLLHASVCLPVVELVVKVANLTFLKPDFKILTFFEHLWLFWKLKKKQKNKIWLFSVRKAWLWKTLSELHIDYKSLLKKVYSLTTICRVHKKILKIFCCCSKNDRCYW